MSVKTGGLCCSGTNGLLTSGFGSSTRGKRHNSYYADHTIWPHQRAAHLAMFKIFVCRDPKNSTLRLNSRIPTTQLHGRKLNSLCPNGRELNCLPAWSNVKFQLTLFQNPQILRTIFNGHDVIHTPSPIAYLGFIMTMVIVISITEERKTVPNDCAPELRAEKFKTLPNWMIKYN